MKREKQLTKRERKALAPPRPSGKPVRTGGGGGHIHCISCGRHLDPSEFDDTARYISCLHGSTFPTCVEHEDQSQMLLAEHDRTGSPVQIANAWH